MPAEARPRPSPCTASALSSRTKLIAKCGTITCEAPAKCRSRSSLIVPIVTGGAAVALADWARLALGSANSNKPDKHPKTKLKR